MLLCCNWIFLKPQFSGLKTVQPDLKYTQKSEHVCTNLNTNSEIVLIAPYL